MTKPQKQEAFLHTVPASPATTGRTLTLADFDAAVAEETRRVARANDRHADVHGRILKIEGQPRKARQADAMGDVLDSILDGKPVEATPDSPSELSLLHAEKQMLIAAIARGNRKLEEARLARAAFIYGQHLSEIVALERSRVLLATKLQSVNVRREALRERLRLQGCGGASFSTDRYADDLLSLPHTDDATMWAQNRAVEDGIVTKAEIAEAKNANA